MASPSLVTSAVAQSDQEAVEIAAFRLPRYSDFLSAETRSGIERMETVYADAFKRCDPRTKPAGAELVACEKLFYPPIVEVARNAFAVDISEHRIGGVRTDIVTPADGTSKANATRVLINVHGGAFKYGARFSGPLDSMAVAAIGKYKVVAVDYRLGADVRFPSASVEVASVYRELLRTHRPEDIGFFGCSGGARIIGQTLAWMARNGLPPPGAVALLCSPPTRFGGDSNIIAAALQGSPPRTRDFTEGYFQGVSPHDPIAFPGDSDAELKSFPPSLLMTSTRDYSLSPMVQMHARMVALNVPSELHIIEGLGHAEFVSNPLIPEARHAARVVAQFFDRHLARSPE